ncbi:exonuclease domain-containing protein [Pediococcus acidilactici]
MVLNKGAQKRNYFALTCGTLTLARFLYPTLKGYRLNTLAKKFNVALEHHHRAIYDAETTGHLCYLFLKDAEERYGIEYHDQLNDHMTTTKTSGPVYWKSITKLINTCSLTIMDSRLPWLE